MNVFILDSNNFVDNIVNSKVPVLVDFYADWCARAGCLARSLRKFLEEYAGN